MKKSLVALAVAAALPAFAQAQTSVQLTGSVDVSLESLNKDANGGEKGDLHVRDGLWGGSRFGIVGSEELGNGTKAIFNLEYRGRADTGRNANAQRFWQGRAWVGLAGGFGTVKLGRQSTPMDVVLPLGDTTGQSWYYSSDGMVSDAAGNDQLVTKVDNSISYQTPTLGGLSLVAAYAAGEQETPTGATGDYHKLGDTVAVGLIGEWNAFSAGVAYQSVDGAKLPDAAAGNRLHKNTQQLGAALGLKLGRFGAGVNYAQSDRKFETGSSIKHKGISGSLSFQTSDTGTVYLTYVRQDPQGDDNNTDGVGLTYNHGLSKRTFVYGAVGIGKEQNGAGADDSKPRRFAVGLRHFF